MQEAEPGLRAAKHGLVHLKPTVESHVAKASGKNDKSGFEPMQNHRKQIHTLGPMRLLQVRHKYERIPEGYFTIYGASLAFK